MHCIAKTCAPELGHALSLNHPKGSVFPNGVSQSEVHGKNNLMTGGIDVLGGGGEMLEQWQIMCAREAANNFLSELKASELLK